MPRAADAAMRRTKTGVRTRVRLRVRAACGGDSDLDFLVNEEDAIARAALEDVFTRNREGDRRWSLVVLHLDIARLERRVGRSAPDHPGDEGAAHGSGC